MSSGILSDDAIIAVNPEGYRVAAKAFNEQFTGAEIIGARAESDEFGGYNWPVLIVKTSSGEVLALAIAHDEEGNGGGFIHIAELELEVAC